MDGLALRRFLSLAISILAMVMAGSMFSFTIYETALKSTFNFSQSEASMIFSFSSFGAAFAFPAGWIYMKCGPLATGLISLILPSGGYVLLWAASTQLQQFFHSKFWLIGIIYFFTGHGTVYLYIGGLMSSMHNFALQHRGFIIGILAAAYGSSCAILSVLYDKYFSLGFVSQHEDMQNLSGFFLTMAIAFVVVSALAALCIKEYPLAERQHAAATFTDVQDLTSSAIPYAEQDFDHSSISSYFDDTAPIVGTVPAPRIIQSQSPGTSSFSRTLRSMSARQQQQTDLESPNEVTGKRLWKRWDFHCILWTFCLAGGANLTVFINTAVILKALDLEDYLTVCAVLLSVTSCSSRVICGAVSDRLKHQTPRSSFIFVTVLACFLVQMFCLFYLVKEDPAFVLLLCVFTGISYGCLWCITPTILSEKFGFKYFGINWGLVLLFSSAVFLAQEKAFGAIYDLYIDSSTHGSICIGAEVCTGLRVCFGFLSACTFCSVVLSVSLSKEMASSL